MATLKRYNGSSWDTIDFGQPHYIGSLSTVAGNASSGSYLSVRWYVSGVDGITTPYDGMKILVKIPLAGVGTAGVMLSINGDNANDYHPLAYNVNSVLTTHFPVNSVKLFTYDASQTMTCYKTSNTATTVTGVWKADSNYDSNTTITYGTLAYYLRPYMKEALYRYKLVMFDNDNRLVPLTTTNNSATAYSDWSSSTNYAKDVVAHRSGKWYKSLQASNKNHAPESNASWWTEVNDKTPTSSSFRPDKIYWYNTTTTISAGAVIGGNTLMSVGYNQPYLAYCNFNKGILAYRLVYLCGTYNKTTGLFTLNGGGTAGSDAYYVQVPTNTANLTLSSYFTSGKDYILVGGTYSSNNYFHLREDHPMYHFDGTNLVPYDTYNENRIEGLIPTVPTKVSDLTNDSGFITSSSLSGYATQTWVGQQGYLTSSSLSSYVPTSRQINGKALSSDITLSASDVQALPNTTSYVKSASVSGNTLTLTTTGLPVTFTPAFSDTNYYPIRSYTSGLQISSYSGSTNCQLYVPNANGSSQAGVVSTTDQTFYGTKTFTANNTTPIVVKSNGAAGYIEFRNSSSTLLGYYGVNSSKKPVFYDTSSHQLAYTSDLTGIHETGDASLEDYYYFSHTLYGSGKIIITSMQDPYSSWDFNLECNGDTVVSNIVYAEIIVNREEIVCCNYVDTSGNWNSLGLTGSYDTIDTWRVGTSVGYGDISVDYIGDFS